eukprot:scaffold77_cov116-Isochrysis_galbana.AAC.4
MSRWSSRCATAPPTVSCCSQSRTSEPRREMKSGATACLAATATSVSSNLSSAEAGRRSRSCAGSYAGLKQNPLPAKALKQNCLRGARTCSRFARGKHRLRPIARSRVNHEIGEHDSPVLGESGEIAPCGDGGFDFDVEVVPKRVVFSRSPKWDA